MHGVEGVDQSNIRGDIEVFVRIPKVGDSEVEIGAVTPRVSRHAGIRREACAHREGGVERSAHVRVTLVLCGVVFVRYSKLVGRVPLMPEDTLLNSFWYPNLLER